MQKPRLREGALWLQFLLTCRRSLAKELDYCGNELRHIVYWHFDTKLELSHLRGAVPRLAYLSLFTIYGVAEPRYRGDRS